MDDLGIRNYILENNPGIAYSLLPSSAIAVVGKCRSVWGVQIVKILNYFSQDVKSSVHGYFKSSN